MIDYWKRLFDTLAFRSLLLSVLIVVIAIVLVKPNIHGDFIRYDQHQSSESAEDKEQSKIFFELSAEGWTAVFTGGLLLATIALFCVTYGLFYVAIRQGQDAENLLLLERRPWIQTRIEISERPEFHDAGIRICIKMYVKNVGLSPAGAVTRGWLYPTFGAVSTKSRFDEFRADAISRMDYMGRTLFPGEEAEIGGNVDISLEAERAERSLILEPLCIPVACVYKSLATNKVYETSRVITVRIGVTSLRTARSSNEARIALEAMNNINPSEGSARVHQVGMFDITT